MKKISQNQIAKELGISKSYLSMILSGKRPCPPELKSKLQSTQGVHKVVNNYAWNIAHNPEVVGSNPTPATKYQS
ncbi:MAG: helix-turn-helix transcriptional regulator [Dehalococcoidales bacterium]|nr:helix-turn-helix transcriptional regulator [Dehalococcoidales bacterium]